MSEENKNTLFIVYENTSKFIVGAYRTKEELDFEVIVNAGNHVYDVNNITIKKEDNVPDQLFHQLVQNFTRKVSVWN